MLRFYGSSFPQHLPRQEGEAFVERNAVCPGPRPPAAPLEWGVRCSPPRPSCAPALTLPAGSLTSCGLCPPNSVCCSFCYLLPLSPVVSWEADTGSGSRCVLSGSEADLSLSEHLTLNN